MGHWSDGHGANTQPRPGTLQLGPRRVTRLTALAFAGHQCHYVIRLSLQTRRR